MAPHIDHIEIAGPDRRARRLVFSGDAAPRMTSAAVVKALGLADDQAVEICDIETVERELARDKALNYLGYRERSTYEVMKRLTNDGYPTSLAQGIVARFVELALIDDTRFAELWARTRASAGYGPRRIRTELEQRGIPADMALDITATAEGDPVARARQSLRGRVPATRQERERLVRKLVRRGFDLRVALAATSGDDALASEDEPFIAE